MTDHLEHYGIKGMRWGVRKKSTSESSPRKISRKENRRLNREAADEFYRKKSETIIKTAMKDRGDRVLVKATLADSPYPQVMTGQQFIRHMELGGRMNVKYTEIYATRGKTGPYTINDNKIGLYKKQNFRKNPPKS